MTLYLNNSSFKSEIAKNTINISSTGTRRILKWTSTRITQGQSLNRDLMFQDTRWTWLYYNNIDISGLDYVKLTKIYQIQVSYSQEWHHGGHIYYRLDNGPWVYIGIMATRRQYGYWGDITINAIGKSSISIKAYGWIEQSRGRGHSDLNWHATITSWYDTSYDEWDYESEDIPCIPDCGNTQSECEVVKSGNYISTDNIYVKNNDKWKQVHEIYILGRDASQNKIWEPVLYENKWFKYIIDGTKGTYSVPVGVFNLQYELIGGTGGGQSGWNKMISGSGAPGDIKSGTIPVIPGQSYDFEIGRDGLTNISPPHQYGYEQKDWSRSEMTTRKITPIGKNLANYGGGVGHPTTLSWGHTNHVETASGGDAGIDFKTFASAGTFTFTVPPNIYLLTLDAVGGGGAGYGHHDGDYGRYAHVGGSAGGVENVELSVTPDTELTIVVGRGGGYGYHWTTIGEKHWTTVEGLPTTVSYNNSVVFTCGNGTRQHGRGSSTIYGHNGSIKWGSSVGGPFHRCCDRNACGRNPYDFVSYYGCDVSIHAGYVTPAVLNYSVPLGGTGRHAGWVSIRWRPGGLDFTEASIMLTQLP